MAPLSEIAPVRRNPLKHRRVQQGPGRGAYSGGMTDALLEDSPPGRWVPDELNGCSRMTLPLGEDEEGPVSATLVRYDGPNGRDCTQRRESPPPAPVVHLHGWSDYFFNLPMARHWSAQGRPFYALDLRKYGRSLRPWQTPGYIDNLHDYDAELSAALDVVGHPSPIIQAHSTGGLVAALWARRNPGRVSALMLNSPWLEMPGDVAARAAVEGLVTPLQHLQPKRAMKLPVMDTYWQSLSEEAQGEWSLHHRWRPRYSFPMRAGWLKAVLAGHREIYEGLDLPMPVLVMLSGETVYRRQWSVDLQQADSVLDVELLARRAVRLGDCVTVLRLPGAMHDVFASAREVRTAALDHAARWLRAYGPEGSPTASTAPPYRRSRLA